MPPRRPAKKLTKQQFKQKYFASINYVPHPRQNMFHDSNARFKIPVCGRRYGKSYMVGKDLGAELLSTENGVFWIVAPTYDLGEKEFRVVYQDLIRTKGLGSDPNVQKSYGKRGNMFIRLANGSSLEVRTADNADSLVGEGLDGVVMAEASRIPATVWNKEIRPSLSNKRGWGIISTTPQGKDWVYREYKRGQDPKYPNHDSWNYPTWENLASFPLGRQDPEILDMEETLSEDEFAQEVAALFSAFSKGVYGEFTINQHVRSHTYNPNWPNYQFWDFGFTGATVCLDVQVDPWDRVYIWREHYVTGVTLLETLEILKHRTNPEGYSINNSFGDSADPDAIETICQRWAPCEGDKEAKDDWKQGVFNVKRFLKMRSDGLPGLLVDPSCTYTIEEFEEYKSASENRYGVIQKEKPLKKNDHCMDCIRYGINHLFFLGPQTTIGEILDMNEFRSKKKKSTAYSENYNDEEYADDELFGDIMAVEF